MHVTSPNMWHDLREGVISQILVL